MRCFFVIALLLPALVSGQTSLWRISDGNNQLYIGGTVHLLSQSDHPFPDEFEQAFREIDTLVLETDLDALMKPQAQIDMKERLTFQNGKTLKNAIRPKTYRALNRYCKANGLSLREMNLLKPSMVALTLTLTEMNRLGLADSGVDQFFLNKAKSSGKKITGLEAAETQIDALENMGKGQEDQLILSTLKDLKKAPQFMDGMKKAWRLGDLDELEKVGLKTLQTEFPQLDRSLLIDRNNAWIPKIKNLLNSPERELILVGALHLAGKDGVLAQLQKQGFSVERY